MITLHDGGVVKPPQGCACYNPHAVNVTNNSTAPCVDTRCSRGDNPICFTSGDDGNIFDTRAFGFYIPANINNKNDFYVFLGCNCPGFNYNHGASGDNGFTNTPIDNGGSYTYTNCSDFSLGVDDADICCNYCCDPAYVSTTTGSVPSIGAMTYSFYSLPVYFYIAFAFFDVHQNN
jgi:hypothetical protein